MIPLTYFVSRLSEDVPAKGDYPTPSQYENATKDAVTTFNGILGRKSLYKFTTVSGQAAYSLPVDFSRIVLLEPFLSLPNEHTSHLMVTAAGLVPLNPEYQETHMLRGDELIIEPPPTYALERRLWYRAVHVLDDGQYPYMTETEASVIYKKAQANTWRLVCGHVTRTQGWSYRFGDTTIDKRNVGQALRDWVGAMDQEFTTAVLTLRGTTIIRG